MKRTPRILIATDASADADVIRKLLVEEFDDVHVAIDSERTVFEFEACKPDILILGFNGLVKAERYYLGLYRLSKQIHALPHRTLILCNKDDLLRVYELCRREYFDDYILFWPIGHDALRLRMAVHHAARQVRASEASIKAKELVHQVREVSGLDDLITTGLEQGGKRMLTARGSLGKVAQEADAMFEGFSRTLATSKQDGLIDVHDPETLQLKVDALRPTTLHTQLAKIEATITSASGRLDKLKSQVAPTLASARAFCASSSLTATVILLIEDDPFQQQLVSQMLDTSRFRLICADSGADGLAVLRKQQPDLILMDWELPDFDGIEVTRHLKSIPSFAQIPIVMVTGRSEKSVVMDSLQAGVSDFLVKPLSKDRLLTKITNLLS